VCPGGRTWYRIAVAIAIPLGLGSAIYLSEYASDRVRRVLKPTLEVLAGIPQWSSASSPSVPH
jgi:ABC-type phosphate transport system permease subunit